ncbi:urease accessory protein UreF [Exilibacterium tricleocarpae]|uniref:Urease accessory protein UreF n=2 Tax=Exilibacterium tricleocarpae TaxID=2591008 RepID=A0A545SZ22_9GAMM|nr:urease accessory protein UreF [Exilibacterium tricleocarpae]
MTITTTDTGLLRLLQLSSAALPVGGYAFSQGLEQAVERGWVDSAGSAREWLSVQLAESLARVDLPLLLRQWHAVTTGDLQAQQHWNAYALACRETAELRLTDTAMGEALRKLLRQLEALNPEPAVETISFVTAFALAAGYWDLERRACCCGFAWSWLENQVAAATKLVPLGQTSAQRILGALIAEVPQAIDLALSIEDGEIGASLPGVAMASAGHEVQYSRLFRS